MQMNCITSFLNRAVPCAFLICHVFANSGIAQDPFGPDSVDNTPDVVESILDWHNLHHKTIYPASMLPVELRPGKKEVIRSSDSLLNGSLLVCEKSGLLIRYFRSKQAFEILLFPDIRAGEISESLTVVTRGELESCGLDIDELEELLASLRGHGMYAEPALSFRLSAMQNGIGKRISTLRRQNEDGARLNRSTTTPNR